MILFFVIWGILFFPTWALIDFYDELLFGPRP